PPWKGKDMGEPPQASIAVSDLNLRAAPAIGSVITLSRHRGLFIRDPAPPTTTARPRRAGSRAAPQTEPRGRTGARSGKLGRRRSAVDAEPNAIFTLRKFDRYQTPIVRAQ